jgi:hypothetical protein
MSEIDIQILCLGALLLLGFAVRGSRSNNDHETLSHWFKSDTDSNGDTL